LIKNRPLYQRIDRRSDKHIDQRIDQRTNAEIPLNHFMTIYRGLDHQEITSRCNLSFDGEAFSLRIMGKQYRALYPDYKLLSLEQDPLGRNFHIVQRPFEKILFLRYLCEGRYVEALGKQLSYREIPWGDLYFPNFEGRCIQRLARTFGNNLETFRKIMEETRDLKAQKIPKADAGYRFDFLSGLSMSFLIWAGDEEFSPSAQILFDDNFPQAFTAEEIVAAAGVAIDHLKALAG
jgi:hypothetical protein